MTAHLRGLAGSLLRVEDLVVDFPIGRSGLKVHAVAGVSFDVMPGETLGLVGESGCGKSTTGRAIMQAPPPTSGRVLLDGVDLCDLHGEDLRAKRPDLQLVLQDPISSLNPRRRVGDIVGQPLRTWGRGDAAARVETVRSLLDAVGLDPLTIIDRRPHELSGGQCQRVGIARALALEPKLMICDEPVSALDVSVQGQVLNLLEDLKTRYSLTIVFIAHDLAVVKSISDRVAVMYLGKLCEVGPVDTVYAAPAHPYTDALLQSVPVPDPMVPPKPAPLAGELPSPIAPPSGCRFRTRCPRAQERCAVEEPVMREMGAGRYAACHFPLVDYTGAASAST
jgi:peptide/nickel transport system ATP-binding protein